MCEVGGVVNTEGIRKTKQEYLQSTPKFTLAPLHGMLSTKDPGLQTSVTVISLRERVSLPPPLTYHAILLDVKKVQVMLLRQE